MKLDFGALPGKVGKSLQKFVGSANERMLKSYQKRVEEINARASWAEGLSDDALRSSVQEWRQKIVDGKATLDDALVDIFALTRVAAQRTIGLRHYDVQLIGGMVLHEGKIAEMMTGEGKTLVATLPAALNALSGKGVYVVTVNDYLAKRDRDWMAPVYEFMGISCGTIQADMTPQMRIPEYECDILYGTNNEFGFDYLRDNMKDRPELQVQKRLNFAIVDEVDSILIDEARTPLIISGQPEHGQIEKYLLADRIVRQLKEGQHFEIKLKEQQCLLTEEGIERAEELAGVGSFYGDPANMDWPHRIEQSLRAHQVYQRDTHYVVAKSPRSGQNEIVIVDEFTGRLMNGRRWSDGLHQAVEAKERLRPQEESMTLATITLQNYFRLFDKLSGMTGTAMTEASEFARIYELDVVAIPTNKPLVRNDEKDVVYLGENDKYDAIVTEIGSQNEKGRPILVGTTSIEKSERLSQELSKAGIEHDVLNAKQHEREAEIVAQAGRRGRVTVATNMAGRGTDIVLGGNPDRMFEIECVQNGVDPESAQSRLEQLRTECGAEQKDILELGGLLVVGTERHEARRIDNQLRGRCGRQGDPGQTRFFLSFDDDLMRIFANDTVRGLMEKLGLKAGERIESGLVTRSIERAQRKVEQRNFDIRKNLIEYDEVTDKQRKFIYSQRQEVLEGVDLQGKVVGMFEEILEPIVEQVRGDTDEPIEWDALEEWLKHKCGDLLDLNGLHQVEREGLFEDVLNRFLAALGKRQEEYGADDWQRILKFLLLDTIDDKWKDHLRAIEVLKAGISLRGYAQLDPKNEFKKEGFEKFQLLKEAIADHITNLVLRVEIRREQVQRQAQPVRPQVTLQQILSRLPADPEARQAFLKALVDSGQAPAEIEKAVREGKDIQLQSAREAQQKRIEEQRKQAEEARKKAAEEAAIQQQVATANVGRNDPCPCGSGKKYKKCHGAG
ncbi:MAG: preprotein translocase subunit SecA [Planctomycetota bacterium]